MAICSRSSLGWPVPTHHPELLILSRLRRLRRLQLIVLLLQLGCLGLLIRVVVREPLPLCRLQQAMRVIRGPIP